MKMPISWHEECLRNRKRTVAATRLRLENELLNVARAEADIQKKEDQIERAKQMGKDAFDEDKFRRKGM